MKAMCLLINVDQKRYILLLENQMDGDNVGRDKYPVTTTSALDILIRTEGHILRNQQSTNENSGGRGGYEKRRTGSNFPQKQQGGRHPGRQ